MNASIDRAPQTLVTRLPPRLQVPRARRNSCLERARTISHAQGAVPRDLLLRLSGDAKLCEEWLYVFWRPPVVNFGSRGVGPRRLGLFVNRAPTIF